MGSLILPTLHSKEDPLLTPVTSAAVCLLKVRENLLRHVGELGYGPQILTLLNKIVCFAKMLLLSVVYGYYTHLAILVSWCNPFQRQISLWFNRFCQL